MRPRPIIKASNIPQANAAITTNIKLRSDDTTVGDAKAICLRILGPNTTIIMPLIIITSDNTAPTLAGSNIIPAIQQSMINHTVVLILLSIVIFEICII